MVDAEYFDTLVQSFGQDTNRRAALGVLFGTLISPALVAVPTLARRRNAKQRGRGRDNGAGRGRDRRDEHDGRVEQDKKKGNKAKSCPACKKRKKGKCKGLLPDGTTCPGGACRSGQCIPTSPPDGTTCTAGFHECHGTCVSDNDVASCGTSCTPCPSSTCSPATCDGVTCGREPIAGCCEDDADCGDSDPCTIDTCGTDKVCTHEPILCPADDPCQDPVCNPGSGCTTVDHCRAGEVCIVEGLTARCCPQDRPLWNGSRCAECTATDLTRCANLANATATCDDQGTCSFICEAGWSDCDAGAGCETDVTRDIRHCGACGHACNTVHNTPTCVDGTCVPGTCDAGWENCDGDPETGCEAHLQTDPDHCGACGHACMEGDVCRAGACTCLPATEDLQAAIVATKSGRTLRLCAGTWTLTQTLPIAKNITLAGAGVEQSILDGNNQVSALRIAIGATVTLKDLTITKSNGRGIFNRGTLTLRRCAVIRNPLGGIYNDHGTLELFETSVTDNIGPGIYVNSAGSGGGIHNEGGTVTLWAGSSVARNGAQHGGGITNLGGTVTLETGSSVADNIAGTAGGIKNYYNTVILKAGSSVTNNSSGLGGGIDNASGTLTLEAGCSVSGNTSTGPGGGIYNGGTLTLEADSQVSNNTAQDGGGIANSGPLTLEPGSYVTGNTAQNGGGIFNWSSLRLKTGSRVEGNTAGSRGGGIYAKGGTLTLETGSHVTNNTAQEGGGVFEDPDSAVVVTVEADDILTANFLTDGTTPSNCAPVNTIPNCIG